MKKNVYLVLLVVSALALIRQIPFFTAGVRLHGRKEKRLDRTSA